MKVGTPGAPPLWVVSPCRPLSGRRAFAFKGALDKAVARALLVALSPLLAVIALAIKLDSRGPVFYRQERVGQFGRAFQMVKFRSMVPGAEHLGLGLWIAQDDSRITRVGRWIRLASLDELPQLFNVSRGDMSIVGPRPGLPDQAVRYSRRQRQRLRVRPGITGWAQVRGRNAISWESRIDHDRWYMRHWSLLLDTYILAKTPLAMLDSSGVYGEDGMPKDLGEE